MINMADMDYFVHKSSYVEQKPKYLIKNNKVNKKICRPANTIHFWIGEKEKLRGRPTLEQN